MIIVILGLVEAYASAPPEALDDQTTAELSARAASRACGPACISATVYLLDGLLYADTLEGEEEPMPDETRTALAEVFDEVEFVANTSEDTGVTVTSSVS